LYDFFVTAADKTRPQTPEIMFDAACEFADM
jgi:hypothetical protein